MSTRQSVLQLYLSPIKININEYIAYNMVSIGNLTLQDIEFLQAVKEINKQPDDYPNTDISDHNANSKNIRKTTDLNTNQVSYRMGGNSNSRGFVDDGIISSADPMMLDDGGIGPRSAALTQDGRDMLDDAQAKMSTYAGVSREEFEILAHNVYVNNHFWRDVHDADPAEWLSKYDISIVDMIPD